MTTNTKKTPAWLVEQAAQGELAPAELAELRSRLAREGRSLDDELEQLRQSNRRILARLPRETMGASIRRQAAREDAAASRSRRFRLYLPLALVGSMGLAVLGMRGLGGSGAILSRGDHVDEIVTSKGDEARFARLLVYRQRPGRASAADTERLGDGALGVRGDLLQLAYDKAPEGMYGVLVSVDGASRTTLHLPDEGTAQSPPLLAHRELRLPSAYELDDAPGFERFILVTARKPFAVNVAVDAAHALAERGDDARTLPLSLPRGFFQTSTLLNKR